VFTKHIVNCDTIFRNILVPEIQPHRNDNDSNFFAWWVV